MATPNYGYEKRQRELAKKKKKEDKLKAKAAGKRSDGQDAPLEEAPETNAEAPADDQAPAAGN